MKALNNNNHKTEDLDFLLLITRVVFQLLIMLIKVSFGIGLIILGLIISTFVDYPTNLYAIWSIKTI